MGEGQGEGTPVTSEPQQFGRNRSPEWERGRGEGMASTSEQRRFARDLRLNGLKFKRQVPVLAYTVDFLCFEKKLIVEIDGKQHAWFAEYDSRRAEEIESQGFVVLRFTNGQF